jgi:hypothetical protein
MRPGLSRTAAMKSCNDVHGDDFTAKLQMTTADLNDAAEIERAIAAFASEPNGGLVVQPDQITMVNREWIAALAVQHRLPACGVSVPLLCLEWGPDVLRH